MWIALRVVSAETMITESVIVLTFLAGAWTRLSPGLWQELWPILVRTTPIEASPLHMFLQIFAGNWLLWFVVYGTAHLLLYITPGPHVFRPFKLNKKYPPNALVAKEIMRSTRGVAIGAVLETLGELLFASGHLPLCTPLPWLDDISPASRPSWEILRSLLLAGVVLMVIGETHFYWNHRLLHTSWLYKNVHKIHHESFNVDPFSGLSMHPIESTIYFTATTVIALFCPLWVSRLMSKSLLLTPLQGHSGHSLDGNRALDAISKAGVDHYIHHTKFNYNYGANPFWDNLLGTAYPVEKTRLIQQGGKKSNSGPLSAREVEARKQAALVGAKYD